MQKKYAVILMLAMAMSVAVAGIAGADSETKPAVSAINAKVASGYANLNDDSIVFGTGTVTVPILHSFGLSVDGIGGSYSSEGMWGYGGNLFWRNPDKGLIGAIASDVHSGAQNVYRFGGDGELYLGPVTLLGDVGYQGGDINKEGVFADLEIRWYAIDNLALGLGGGYSGEIFSGTVGVEYMPNIKPLEGLSLFADGSLGQKDYYSVVAGVKYYFGPGNKSLKERHREDDPTNNALKGLTTGSQAGFPYKHKDPTPTVDDIITDDTETDIISDTDAAPDDDASPV